MLQIYNFNNFYYRDLDLTNCQVGYNEIDNEDGSKEYVFDNKNIIIKTTITKIAI